jgi:hypothetical protein
LQKVIRKLSLSRSEDNLQHWKNLLDCSRRNDKNTWSPMDLAYRTQTVLQMAVQSHRRDKTMHYDKEKMEMI